MAISQRPFVSSSYLRHDRRHNRHVGSGLACVAKHKPWLVSAEEHRLKFFSGGRRRYHTCARAPTIPPCFANVEPGIVGENISLPNMERKARIRKQLLEPDLLPSAYDTAWVAMVPLPGSPQVPCFPQCVEWILQNQQRNGSWGLSQLDSKVNKDLLSSTLACVLALKKWSVGREHIRRGLRFIGSNFPLAMDYQAAAPIGFNITFAAMVSLAIEMGLEFPVAQAHVDGILHFRDMELERLVWDKSYGREAYMAYVAEGLGNLLDWNKVMKFQRKNGSLFNSPSSTAAALLHNYDDKALQYLNFLVTRFGNSVPTVYPTRIYCQLLMVDSLEKIGISQHFYNEIKGILDVTYSLWLHKDEEIMLDVATSAMAFRHLRMNGYDVSPDELSHVVELSNFRNSLQGYLNDTKSILELYKASKVSVSENEFLLDSMGYWSGSLLMEKLLSDGGETRPIFGEVEYTLKFPFYATMERLDHKRNIEQFDSRGSQMLKTEYVPCCVNQDLMSLAVEDFTFSQSIYQGELRHLERWAKENRLEHLQFARQRLTYCYLSAAATIFSPELSDARISWAKNSILTAAADDFFDVGGSNEELQNLVALVEKWDEHSKDDFYSEQVKILFYAIYTTVNQLGTMASEVQNRDVREHMIELWLQLLRSMMTETKWRMRRYVPTIEEYMSNAVVSFALGPIVLTSLYFVEKRLFGSIVNDYEYNALFRLMSTCGRLLNDLQGFERESSEGKLDSVSLLVIHSDGSMSTGAAKEAIRRSIASCRKDLLRLVLQENSVVPRACRELFWKMCKVCHLFFSHTDEFTSPSEMVSAVNALINEPLKQQNRNLHLSVQSDN
ncbi:ent-kaur-16-ene synthase, chloroplastic-like isoform X2 [Lolium perenne]|uniref:ent-kaur-16-ene synthase, chloroplastic-like isoform X2 n=1 Tax=Lolium perenne TaxID=4522 RepID=UPI0021F55BF0|nr:ent-kaur-16-ene synthase, chloroplastic-like isoform X2 [Lolium perenne]